MKTIKKILPISICWNLTSRCNYNCKFCFEVNSRRELYFNEAEKILYKLIKAGIRKISFCGGEPLLWPGIINLIKLAHDNGLITMMITNGSLLTATKIKQLKGILDWISLPLDGSNDNEQFLAGRKKGHFKQVVKLLSKLKNTSIKIKINTVLTHKNAKYLEELEKIIKKYSVRRWKIFQFFPIRNKGLENRDTYFLSTNNFKKIKKRIMVGFKNSKCSLYFGTNKDLENTYINIAPDGTVYVSQNYKDYLVGDLKKQNLLDIWEHDKLIDKGQYWERVSWILKEGDN